MKNQSKTRRQLKQTLPTPAFSKAGIQTPTLAQRFDVSTQTIRKHLCLKGHFFGLTPLKMPNGRNIWPDVWPADVIGQ